MSTLRINNIEAQSIPASPTIDEKVKVTNSSGDILVNIDGKTSGITTIGINTTDGNIKFDANSNVLITGILTATTLSGNFTPTSLEIGSNIKLGNAGVITATSFVGSGANLTGITGTTINNNANNRIITGSDTANTLEAETSLEWDGTNTLTVVHPSSYQDYIVRTKAGGSSFELFRTGNGPFRIRSASTSPSSDADELVIGATNATRGLTIFGATNNIFFGDDSDNDIGKLQYVHSDNSMRFTTNTAERLRIDSSGRMGLGTNAPNGYDNEAENFVVASADHTGITIASTGSNKRNNLYFADGTSGNAAYRGAITYDHNIDDLYVRTAGTERLRITNEGYIHLGNSGHGTNKVGGQNVTGQDYDPYFKLYSSTNNHWLMQLRSDTATGGNGIFVRSGNSSSNYTLYATGYDENNAHLLVRGDGVVSIGAKYTQGGANPLLSLYGSTGRAFKIMNSGASTSGMQMQNSTTGYGEDAGIHFACLSGGSAYLVNQTNNVDFMVMYSKVSGSTKHIMQIYNDGKIGHQTNSDNLMLSNSQDGSGSNYFLRGSKNSTTPGGGNDCVWIYEDGDLRNNNNSYGQQSDIKLKENVVAAGSQWDDIKNLKVRKFNFKASTGFDTHTQIGLIAQEAELVSPGLVKEVKDRVKTEEVSEVDGSTSYKESLSETEKTKHVMYSVLYMKAIKALQEAMTRIETLEAKVAALEGS